MRFEFLLAVLMNQVLLDKSPCILVNSYILFGSFLSRGVGLCLVTVVRSRTLLCWRGIQFDEDLLDRTLPCENGNFPELFFQIVHEL